MSAEPHEVLRERPPVELMGALLAAIVDRHGRDPLRCCYTLIAVAATMAEHLPCEDRLSAVREMHRVAIDMLPPQASKSACRVRKLRHVRRMLLSLHSGERWPAEYFLPARRVPCGSLSRHEASRTGISREKFRHHLPKPTRIHRPIVINSHPSNQPMGIGISATAKAFHQRPSAFRVKFDSYSCLHGVHTCSYGPYSPSRALFLATQRSSCAVVFLPATFNASLLPIKPPTKTQSIDPTIPIRCQPLGSFFLFGTTYLAPAQQEKGIAHRPRFVHPPSTAGGRPCFIFQPKNAERALIPLRLIIQKKQQNAQNFSRRLDQTIGLNEAAILGARGPSEG
jgi:hypothetical protein